MAAAWHMAHATGPLTVFTHRPTPDQAEWGGPLDLPSESQEEASNGTLQNSAVGDNCINPSLRYLPDVANQPVITLNVTDAEARAIARSPA